MDNKDRLVWSEEHTVHASDTDHRSRGKLSFVLDIMQRAADSAVTSLGFSLEEMMQADMGWMMITLDLEFKRAPLQNDQLCIRTWSKGTRGALWQRDYRIFDGNGTEIAVARSVWALVDIQKRKILRPNVLPRKVEHYIGDTVGETPDKVSIPADVTLHEVYRYQVRYSGLDNYGHLNNARYGDLCCDALPLSEFEGKSLGRFRITYLQEATYGEEMVISASSITDEGVYVRGEGKEIIFFEACLELRAD
jgi:medium-chain acyl-[acyl-carrier-protein] hydrolase